METRQTPDRFVGTLEMTNREVETDELLYSMDVGSVFEVGRWAHRAPAGLSFA
jgi:hypothetical protein